MRTLKKRFHAYQPIARMDDGFFDTLYRPISLLLIIVSLFNSCSGTSNEAAPEMDALVGTWKLMSGIQVKGRDSIFIDYTEGQEMIKIYNGTHFAFLRHDLQAGKDSSSAIFVAGGGRYQVQKDTFTEFLDYCNYREWENHTFELHYAIIGDTLVTHSIERIEALNVDQINIEKLIRLK